MQPFTCGRIFGLFPFGAIINQVVHMCAHLLGHTFLFPLEKYLGIKFLHSMVSVCKENAIKSTKVHFILLLAKYESSSCFLVGQYSF